MGDPHRGQRSGSQVRRPPTPRHRLRASFPSDGRRDAAGRHRITGSTRALRVRPDLTSRSRESSGRYHQNSQYASTSGLRLWSSVAAGRIGRAVRRRSDRLPDENDLPRWDGRTRLKVAVLVDVDGTLAGPYRNGSREIRPSAVDALALASRHAPVFLWSIAGDDNGTRLLEEFPALRRFVTRSFSKDGFPLHLVDRAYAVDDDDCDD